MANQNDIMETAAEPGAADDRPKSDSAYEVGYGRPPKRHRFPKGKSGNPRGRPKGSKNLKTELIEEFQEKIEVREDGKARRLSKQRAMIKRHVANAMTGNERSFAKVIDLYLRVADANEKSDDADDLINDQEWDVLKELEKRFRRRLEGDQGHRVSNSATDAGPDDPNNMLN